MTQPLNSGGDDFTRSTSTGDLDTTRQFATVPVVPQGTTADQVLSQPAPVGATTGGSTGMGATGGGSGAQSAVDQTQQRVGEAVDQAQQKATQVVGQARETAVSQAESQKGRAAESLATVAQAIRQTGEELRGREQGAIAGYADTVAERVERFANTLRERDVNQLVREAQSYARRNPAVFVGGAFTLGLLAARFLKSSSQPDQEEMNRYRYGSQGYTYTTGYERRDVGDIRGYDATVAGRSGYASGPGTTGYGVAGDRLGGDVTTGYGTATADRLGTESRQGDDAGSYGTTVRTGSSFDTEGS